MKSRQCYEHHRHCKGPTCTATKAAVIDSILECDPDAAYPYTENEFKFAIKEYHAGGHANIEWDLPALKSASKATLLRLLNHARDYKAAAA